MRRVIRYWGALFFVWLVIGCSSGDDPCTERIDQAECETADQPEIRTRREALRVSHSLGAGFVRIEGRAPESAGVITASSGDARARCAGSTCYVPLGASVTLEARPAGGVMFSGWSGCNDSMSSTLTLSSVQASATCMANFAVRVIGAGNHPRSPRPIPLEVSARGARQETSVSYLVPYGASVVVALPSGYAGKWRTCAREAYSGNRAFLLRVTSEAACYADLTDAVEVSWDVTPAHSGRVRPEPGAACSRDRCSVPLYGSVVLEAVPSPGYRFRQWSGCSTASSPRISLFLSSSDHCSAMFERYGITHFSGLGDLPGGEFASYATDVSEDGTVVVGDSRVADGNEAFRWTREDGLTGLGGEQSHAEDVSPDGRYIVGSVDDPEFEGGPGAIWAPGAPLQILGPSAPELAPPPGLLVALGRDVRNDGTVYASCYQQGSHSGTFGCIVNEAGEATVFPGGSPGEILVADDSGRFAGYVTPAPREPPAYGSRAFFSAGLPSDSGYPTDAPCLAPHQCRSEATAFSNGGAVIVGTSRIPPPGQLGGPAEPLRDTAWVATQTEGMLRLPDLPGGEEASGAFDVSADGRVIGGFGTNVQGRRAVLWIDRVAHSLEELIQAAGGTVPIGWMLHEVTAMSQDARVLVGNGTNPDGNPEAFRVALRVAP